MGAIGRRDARCCGAKIDVAPAQITGVNTADDENAVEILPIRATQVGARSIANSDHAGPIDRATSGVLNGLER